MTRKLTMHDGKIIEDKKIGLSGHGALPYEMPESLEQRYEYLEEEALKREQLEEGIVPRREGRVARAEAAEKAAEREVRETRHDTPKPRKMRKTSEIRLGVRNTFNLPAKFILLFIVYFFVSTAVLSQFATTKNSMHESDLLGTNPYFSNSSSDRLIVKKNDESSFTDADFKAVASTPNVKDIVKNDLALDSGVSFSLGDAYVEGPVLPMSQADESKLTFGHMPANDYEIVIKVDTTSDVYLNVSGNGEAFVDAEVTLQDMNQMQKYQFGDKIKLAGIIIDEDPDDSDHSVYGYSTVYASDTVCNELLISMMAASSKSTMNFNGTRVESEYERSVFSSSEVPEGKVYLFEDQVFYYPEEQAIGKDFSLAIKNRFFKSDAKFTVDKIITSKNCKDLVGIPKNEYDMYYNCVFISNEDFNKLFDKGFYQISAFMQNEQDSEETQTALKEKGYTVLAIKDSLSDSTGGFDVMIGMMTYGRLFLEFLILFFIAYAVIRLIMRSRNSYYSTLRILGATKSNTDNILRVELILMMIIAYGVDLLFVALVKVGVINIKQVSKLLYYLTPVDYIGLGLLLLIMSLFIANRYSRRIFTRSAMKAFREGA